MGARISDLKKLLNLENNINIHLSADLAKETGKSGKLSIDLAKEKGKSGKLSIDLDTEAEKSKGLTAENLALRSAYVKVNETQIEILEEIAGLVKQQGFEVELVRKRGIIRLPQAKLFDSGEWKLSKGGKDNLGIMVDVLKKVLPCFVSSSLSKSNINTSSCSGIAHKIEAIYLEGHADQRPVPPGGRYKDNAELAAKRALSAFAIIDGDGFLKHMQNDQKQYLFGVSGYGKTRLICNEENEHCYKQNRRIDLRFVMQAPDIKKQVDRIIGANNN